MCGIAGILVDNGLSAVRSNQELLVAIHCMTETLVSRGPDSGNVLIEAPIAFGHRRLSIIDLTVAGAQPMRFGFDGPILTYNGEIYNFKELRHSLESLGHADWRGYSDTEVILHAYVQWGFDGLKRLEGIFALGLWDPAHRRLVLMRDRLGVKPLFYGSSELGLVFGSEIKALLAAGGVDTTLDDQALSEYLWYGNSYEDRTFFRGIRELQPGQWLIVENGRHRLESWWRIEEWLDQPAKSSDISEAKDLVLTALDRAVNRQLVSDVPMGIFLSGGIDSSAIAASARQQHSRLINSYAAGFDFSRGVNELPKAAMVAKHLGLNHHELSVESGTLESVLCKLAKAHDEPFGDAANIPLYLMCQLLQGQIKVVLQGDGGDELFAGYRRYTMLQNVDCWRFWPKALSPLVRASSILGQRIARIADSVGHADPAMRMALLLTVETLQQPPEKLFLPERQRQLVETTDPFLVYRKAAQRFNGHEPVQQMLLTDLTVQLPSQFLTKVDRATMALGVEARVPLLDEGVVRSAVSLPTQWKVNGLKNKIVLRKSQLGRLPYSILASPKTGFGVPYEAWIRTSLSEFTYAHLLDAGFVNHFALDALKVERILNQHQKGVSDKGFLLWKLLQLALFRQTN